MYLERTERLRPGDVVAESIRALDGTVLLAEGTRLDERLISTLVRRDIPAVQLCDGLADDIVPERAVSEETRSRTAVSLKRVISGLQQRTLATTTDDAVRPAGVEETARRLGERPLPLSEQEQRDLEGLQRGIESIVDEILDGGAVGSLTSLKSHSDYTFQHSVDVAITSTLLAHLVGLPRAELRTLALGAALHDLGKTYIDLAILDKPGALDPEERHEIERHPRLGFELIKRLPLPSILPAHIALQHHERQDGTGYPNGLDGTNAVMRSTAERLDRQRMLLVAEICAVADVHSALSSDRPYRPGMPPERVQAILEDMAGPHLNSEIVALFLAGVPMYTVGTWVELAGGTVDGWRGVVVASRSSSLDRPVVRVLVGPDGRAASRPEELDLEHHPEILIRGLPPGDPLPERAMEHAGS